MHIVHPEFPENVLAVGIDSMETGETLLCYFLSCHTKGYVFQYVSLCGSEFDNLLFPLRSEQ